MRRFLAVTVALGLVACGGASPDMTDGLRSGANQAATGLGVASHWDMYRFRNIVYNDFAVPGDTALIGVLSTDPAFLEDRACNGGAPPVVGDDWTHLRVQDVFPGGAKETVRQAGTLYTRVYETTFPASLAGIYCDLIQGRVGTLVAEGTSRGDLFDRNFCTVNEAVSIVGGGHLATTPAFACESGTARFDYAYRYTLSKNAAVDADCNLTAGELLFSQIDGPNLTCIGK